MVTIDKIKSGIVSYLDHELIPMIPEEGFQRVMVGTAISLMLRQYSNKLDTIKDNQIVKMMGVINDNGDVDLETLRDEIKKQMSDDGVKMALPVVGTLTFKRGDIDKLYQYIMNV